MVGAGAGVAPFRAFWEDLRRGPQVAPDAWNACGCGMLH